jgi:hypothetical protein
MKNLNMNVNDEGLFFVSLTSLSQNLNMASKIDLVIPTTQSLPPLPRTAVGAKDYILHVAPDFDATFEFAE